MKDEVAGMSIPDELIAYGRRAGQGCEKEEGIKICLETIERVRQIGRRPGIHLMPVGWESITLSFSKGRACCRDLTFLKHSNPPLKLLLYGGSCRSGRYSAVDEQRLAGDVGGCVRCQKYDRTVEVVRLAGPLQRNPSQDTNPLRVLVKHGVLCRLEPSRCKAVNRHAVPTPVVRQSSS